MLASMIRRGFDIAKSYQKYPQTVAGFDFYEAHFEPLVPTKQALNLLNGRGKLVYNIRFPSDTGTFFNYCENGSSTGVDFLPYMSTGFAVIEDYESLSAEQAVKIVLEKHPHAHFTYLSLRQNLYPGIKIPSYYFGTASEIQYKVDLDGKLSLIK